MVQTGEEIIFEIGRDFGIKTVYYAVGKESGKLYGFRIMFGDVVDRSIWFSEMEQLLRIATNANESIRRIISD